MKRAIRLNVDALMHAAYDLGLDTDTKIAAAIGVSTTQIWRAKLPINDTRHSPPGTAFIAGVLSVFNQPFERFFFLDHVLQGRNKKAV